MRPLMRQLPQGSSPRFRARVAKWYGTRLVSGRLGVQFDPTGSIKERTTLTMAKKTMDITKLTPEFLYKLLRDEFRLDVVGEMVKLYRIFWKCKDYTKAFGILKVFMPLMFSAPKASDSGVDRNAGIRVSINLDPSAQKEAKAKGKLDASVCQIGITEE